MVVVKLNGQVLNGAIVKGPPQDMAGKLHGEFYVPGLRATHTENTQQQFGAAAKKQVGFTVNDAEIAMLGATVQIEDDGTTYTGRVVAVSGERVEWEE